MGRLTIIAENRSPAGAIFILDMFRKEPRSLVIVDPQHHPDHIYRARQEKPTWPGMGCRVQTELSFEPDYNDAGPCLWFTMPDELRKKFYLHEVTWEGARPAPEPTKGAVFYEPRTIAGKWNLLKRKGFI